MKRILAVAVGLNLDNDKSELWRNVIGSSQNVPLRPYVGGLIDGLKARGMNPGQDFQIDYGTCEPRGFVQFVKSAVGQTSPDAIFAMSTTAVKAAMAASKTIPIVFPSVSDPVEDGIVKSCAAPGKNATGIQAMRRHTADQCLELFKATVPSLRAIVALHKPDYGPAKRAYAKVRAAAGRARIAFSARTVRSHKEIVALLSNMSPELGSKGPTKGVLIMPDDLALSAWPKIAKIAGERKIPNFFPVTDWVRSEGLSVLAGFGVPQRTCGEAAAAYMHKVLQGVPPQALPVKPSGGFEWAVNATLARAMGMTVPTGVLSAADRVI